MPAVAGVMWGFGGRGVGTAWRGFPEVLFEGPSVVRRASAPAGQFVPVECVGLATLGKPGPWERFAALTTTEAYRVVRLPSVEPPAQDRFARLLARGGVGAWRGLTLLDAGPESLSRVAECPLLAALEWVRLLATQGQPPDAGAVAALVGSPHLPRLAWVEVRTRAGERLAHREAG